MIDTVGSLGYAKKLGKYGFSDRLCSCKEQCEEWLDFCKKNDMVWFEGSYGTLVHKKFKNHFKRIVEDEHDVLNVLGIEDYNYQKLFPLNHSNVLESKYTGVRFVTSSPNYLFGEVDILKNYPYPIYLIDTRLLEDYMLDDYTIAYSDASYCVIKEINNRIYEDIGIYKAFRRFK